MHRAIHFIAVTFIGLATPLAGLAVSRPAAGQVALVVVPPWQDAETIVRQSGGRQIGLSRSRHVTLALSEDDEFADGLKRNGAWFVADGRALALICGATG